MSQKTVLITGASRGIGLTFCKQYKALGWKIIAAVRNPEAAANTLSDVGVDKIVQLEVTDEPSILNAAKELEGEAIDLLLNNAGILDRLTLETTTKEDMLRHYDINTVGPFLITRAFLPNLRAAVAKNGSAIVGNMSSWLGCITEINAGGPMALYAYRGSKSALNMVTAAYALDLKADGIIAVALHPGVVATEITAFKGPVQPEDSVRGLIKVLSGVTMEQTGKFLTFDERELPW
ncbi:hypothetical protein Poli38472_004062 [Pythium oligandrum]|uniref:Uncharacterized protein n=1 Tax=Pythium oligandrum TaxID=41045 RepID=A0A8K1CPL2_PYTOL|nr:hypothetical protein Poli38472_004062 [Pythium oligandrum]|eukprot:TMW66297.1 hypothetical protein Poli38472_004062 [Pythium oligandrum]